ncbi:filament-like plant protein 1 [Phaseolus vulgaris]|uniref:filament-like plant protein 1 n=1 Tax=Phaseolus vulgaris TaxID=3885 RepID=UPI0035C9D2CE
MLGKGKLAELGVLARTHKLASSSQTVPNSVVEIAAAQGRSPPQGPAPPEALPAPQRKKLVLKKPKRKTPQVVQEDEDEDDEETEDGLITKRRRVAPSSPPALPTPTPPSHPAPTPPSSPAPTPPVQAVPLAAALPAIEGHEPNFMENPPSASTPFVSAGEGPPSTTSIAEAAPGGDEGAHNSPILITESPTSPPRQEAQPHQPIQEGGGESQHQAPSAPPPTAAASLPLAVKGIWWPFTAKLKMMAEDLPSIITKAVESSNKKLQDDISTLEEENRLIRIEAEKLSCNLMMAEIDHSRVEDAMSAELRVARKETSDLHQKLHLLAQEKIELESKLVPYRLKVADLEASIKADAAKVENLGKRSVDREVLLGKVKKERDDVVAKLVEAREENEKIAAELAQAREESKKVADDLAQTRRETEELKKRADELKQQTEGLKQQNEELELSSAQVLAAGFDAALEQVACQYPELDLSMVLICNEVVDGKIVPSED